MSIRKMWFIENFSVEKMFCNFNTGMSTSFSRFFTLMDQNRLDMLGYDVVELLNALKLIHGYHTTIQQSYDTNVKPMGQITEEMVKIFEECRKATANSAMSSTRSEINFSVLNYNSEYIPEMPVVSFLYKNGTNEVFLLRREKIIDMQMVDGNKLDCKVEVEIDLLGAKYSLKDYHNFVKDELQKLIPGRSYDYFTTKMQELDSINSNNATAFSDEFKKLDIYKSNKSFLDYILRAANLVEFNGGTTSKELSKPTDPEGDPRYKNEMEIYEYISDMHAAMILNENRETDNMNSLVVDIMNSQKKIEETKDNVGKLRKRLYTYVSREANYSKNLGRQRQSMYMVLCLFVLISVVYLYVGMATSISIENKTLLIVSLATCMVAIQVFTQIMDTLRIRSDKKRLETFEDDAASNRLPEGYGFAYVTGSSNLRVTTFYDADRVLGSFVDKFNELLTSEIRQEYFDTLKDAQKKDIEVLKAAEREHRISSHFHMLKNNLTHYKINEAAEYTRFFWRGIILVSLIAALHTMKLQGLISTELFQMVSGVLSLAYVTYVLLSVKSMMLRDKQDWDRFHWTVSKLGGNNKEQSCSALSGFTR